MLKEAAFQMGEDEADLITREPGEVFSTKTGKSLSYAKLSHDTLSGGGHDSCACDLFFQGREVILSFLIPVPLSEQKGRHVAGTGQIDDFERLFLCYGMAVQYLVVFIDDQCAAETTQRAGDACLLLDRMKGSGKSAADKCDMDAPPHRFSQCLLVEVWYARMVIGDQRPVYVETNQFDVGHEADLCS